MQQAVVWSILGIGLSAVLLLVILVGGFFMFRAFLRKMGPDQNRSQDQ